MLRSFAPCFRPDAATGAGPGSCLPTAPLRQPA